MKATSIFTPLIGVPAGSFMYSNASVIDWRSTGVLASAGSGMVIGSWVFDFTQQPLAADLTTLPDFVQGGGKWRTREDILDKSLAKTAGKIAGTVRVPGAR